LHIRVELTVALRGGDEEEIALRSLKHSLREDITAVCFAPFFDPAGHQSYFLVGCSTGEIVLWNTRPGLQNLGLLVRSLIFSVKGHWSQFFVRSCMLPAKKSQ
jgi:hypothetical protein